MPAMDLICRFGYGLGAWDSPLTRRGVNEMRMIILSINENVDHRGVPSHTQYQAMSRMKLVGWTIADGIGDGNGDEYGIEQ